MGSLWDAGWWVGIVEVGEVREGASGALTGFILRMCSRVRPE